MNKLNIKTKELFEECPIPFLKETFEKAEFPWQILPKIKEITQTIMTARRKPSLIIVAIKTALSFKVALPFGA